MSDQPLPVMTVEEVAEYLRVHPRTVREWTRGKRPKIPVIRVGRSVRFHRATITSMGRSS